MELSLYQRQVLSNQYAILAKLTEDKEEKKIYEDRQEIYEQGFEGEYFEHVPYEDVLDKYSCDLVYKIINMYDDLYYYWNDSENIKKNINEYDVKFPGFDLNDSVEHKFYSFAKFLLVNQGKFHDTREMLESKEIQSLNSHGSGPGLAGYTVMLERFEAINKERFKRTDKGLSLEDIKSIIDRF